MQKTPQKRIGKRSDVEPFEKIDKNCKGQSEEQKYYHSIALAKADYQVKIALWFEISLLGREK